jgi:LuxR family maltose regulon positive regulatory protein
VVVVGPLLTTKLHVPRRRRGLIPRPRLSERLSRGDEAALTLVSAPAGFGKTTVLTEWLAAAPGETSSVAWLSLDARDNDPALFWSYLVAALQTVAPEVGAGALALLQSPQASGEAFLATLVNDLAAIPGDVVLVLDDYHVIASPEIQDGMTFLLEHLPQQVHLVLAGRADPPLPLARLRGRGELVELRAADLRFGPEEAAAYLTEAMGLDLTAADVAALENRTEGWIAALQLAALSMQGRDDVAGFITGFAGDDRYIVDYLVEEVLQRQPDQIRSFLLQTSILGRLSAPLCDAVTGRGDGKDMLETLDRSNLFLVALDDRRRWYRYHHLFSDVLHAHLLDEQPAAVAGLHRRAADWYERNGDRSEAIGHALAGGDGARAAGLVELALPVLHQARQEATARGWLEALPEEVFRARPVLSVGYAASLMIRGELQGVEARLRDAERWLTPDENDREQMIVVDEDAFDRLPSSIALYRAGQAHLAGDVTSLTPGITSPGQHPPVCWASPTGEQGTSTPGTGGTPSARPAWRRPGSCPT